MSKEQKILKKMLDLMVKKLDVQVKEELAKNASDRRRWKEAEPL